MNFKSFDLLIIYYNGDKKIIKHVNYYGISDSSGYFYYEKNGFRSYIPVNRVMFFGRLFDYEEE